MCLSWEWSWKAARCGAVRRVSEIFLQQLHCLRDNLFEKQKIIKAICVSCELAVQCIFWGTICFLTRNSWGGDSEPLEGAGQLP